MTAVEERAVDVGATSTVSVTIDGHQVAVPEGTTIFDAAREVGVDIPVLCHNERYDPVGVCRMCVVDTGGRVFAAACVRPVGPCCRRSSIFPPARARSEQGRDQPALAARASGRWLRARAARATAG